MVTKNHSEPTPVEKPKATKDPLNKAFGSPHPKHDSKVAQSERTPKLSDMPNLYESANSAAHPASGLLAQTAQHALDEIEEQSGQYPFSALLLC